MFFHYIGQKAAIAGRSLIEGDASIDRFAMTERKVVKNHDTFTVRCEPLDGDAANITGAAVTKIAMISFRILATNHSSTDFSLFWQSTGIRVMETRRLIPITFYVSDSWLPVTKHSSAYLLRLVEEAKREKRSVTNYLEATLAGLWKAQGSLRKTAREIKDPSASA